MKKIKVALGQLLVEGGEPIRNIERAERLIIEASQKGCDIILLPECLDYGWTHPSGIDYAKPIPGEFSQQFSNFAKKNKIFICAGLTEKDPKTEENFNTAILIDDQGNIILKYQKINILEEAFEFYNPGKKLEVLETKFGNIGINICSDNYKNAIDIGLVLGRMGADIILSPSSWTVDYNITEDLDPYNNKWINQFLTISKIFDITVVSTTSVGYIVGGPYEGKKMVGCSIATNSNGLITKGDFNEFASDLKIIEINVNKNKIKGTQIGKKINSIGIYR